MLNLRRLVAIGFLFSFTAFGSFDFLLRPSVFDMPQSPRIDPGALSEEDAYMMNALIRYLQKNAKPTGEESLGKWFAEVALLLPPRLPSLTVTDPHGASGFFDDRNGRGLRSYGETFYTYALLSAIHRQLFPGHRVQRGPVALNLASYSVPFSPQTFLLAEATLNIRETDLTASILTTLLRDPGPDTPYLAWAAPGRTHTPSDLRLFIMRELENHWLVSHSKAIKSAALDVAMHDDEPRVRGAALKVLISQFQTFRCTHSKAVGRLMDHLKIGGAIELKEKAVELLGPNPYDSLPRYKTKRCPVELLRPFPPAAFVAHSATNG